MTSNKKNSKLESYKSQSYIFLIKTISVRRCTENILFFEDVACHTSRMVRQSNSFSRQIFMFQSLHILPRVVHVMWQCFPIVPKALARPKWLEIKIKVSMDYF